MGDDLHIHCSEVTGIMGVSEQKRQIPCDKCDWGHEDGSTIRGLKVSDFLTDERWMIVHKGEIVAFGTGAMPRASK